MQTIFMPQGILGFPNITEYQLNLTDDLPFMRLEAQGAVSPFGFTIIPWLYLKPMLPILEPLDMAALGPGEMAAYVIVTIPQDVELMTGIFKAPLVVNTSVGLARQCVLAGPIIGIREPIFEQLIAKTSTRANTEAELAFRGET